jgi:hypothetical protein
MTASTPGNLTTGDQAPSVVEVLQKARALIEKPENWTQGEFKTTDGRFCSVGALNEACPGCNDVWERAYDPLQSVAGGGSVSAFNDTHTHAEVLAAFDKAIELAKSSPVSASAAKEGE